MVGVVVALAALAPVAAEAAAAMVLELAVVLLVLAVVGVVIEVAVWAGREAGYTQTDDLLAAGGNAVERYSAMPLPRRSRFHCPVSIHQ
jgi:hypothetical protein